MNIETNEQTDVNTALFSILMWTEHRNKEGRTYWFNTATEQSVWEKPDELKTPFERALNQTKWKEYFSGGRKYYYNTDSKESKWDMPDELLLLLEKVEKEGQAASAPPRAITAPGFAPVAGVIQGGTIPVGGTNPSSSTTTSQTGHQNGVTSTAVGLHTGVGGTAHPITATALPLAANTVLPARPNLPDDPVIPHNGFQTVEEGEKAFTHLLRKAGVDANWTWDQTMRAIITDPLYKALNTLAEKKACWEKYTTGLKQKEQEEREARLAKLRPAIRNMLRGNPNVFHYTTFRTADKIFSQHPIWQQAKIEAERKLVLEEYVAELKEREVNETRASRSRATAKVVTLFKDLNVDVLTRWREAYERLTNSEDWNSDSELRKLPSLDILLAFEDYNRVREREYEEQTRKQQVEKTRKERKAREGFRELLHELIQDGKIKARTKWKEVYPAFRDDKRYLDMLGNPGSNPLELFWDVVDGFDQKLDKKIVVAEDAIKRYNERHSKQNEDGDSQGDDKINGGHRIFSIAPLTTWQAFCTVVDSELDAASGSMTEDDLRMVYKTLHDAAVKKHADEKRRAERKQRHLQDDLRYAMKKLSDPIDISTKYEDAVALIEHLAEFKALEDEEGRRAAFAKFVKRQKERMRETGSEDGGSTTSRKRKEPVRDYREDDRDKDRDRDRGEKDKREKDSHRERDRDRDRGKEYERRSSRHHHSRYDDYEDRKVSRDYDKEREYRSSSTKYHREEKEEREKDKDGGREKKRERDGKDKEKRDWEKSGKRPLERERSSSHYEEKNDTDERSPHAEKRARYDLNHDAMDVDKRKGSARAESPEEGEI